MMCLISIYYKYVVNSNPTKNLKAKRGIGQGDPVSPYLFVMVMKYLTRLLGKLKHQPYFNFHPRREKLNSMNLYFADDVLLFTRGDRISVELPMKQFKNFSEVTGLNANIAKSMVFFGGVEEGVR